MLRLNVIQKTGLAAVLLNAVLAWGAGSYSIEPAKISSSVPKNITNDLDPSGVLLFTSGTGVKEEICTIFWAKTTAAAAAPSAEVGYSSIREGALVGVIHLFREATEDYDVDFNDQKLKPGYYTMRYAVQPAGTGEHGPIAGDFVVLSPIAMDSDPDRVLSKDEMLRFGKLVSNGNEAARMQLVPVEDSKDTAPGVTTDGSGSAIVHFKMHLAVTKGAPAQQLNVDLTVVTPKPDLGRNSS
ncbi:MAG: hypothetical protein WAN65_06605 [Candidatus Sulfotelmatobacter sp.]